MKIKLNKAFLFVIPAIIGFTDAQAQKKNAVKEPGINVSFFDKSVKPADNFFRYVNGTWLDKSKI